VAHQVQWTGTREARRELLAAARRHCACSRDGDGIIQTACAAHLMLVRDQRALDGLVFARRIAARLRAEEWA
jgi:hypothetical protein